MLGAVGSSTDAVASKCAPEPVSIHRCRRFSGIEPLAQTFLSL